MLNNNVLGVTNAFFSRGICITIIIIFLLSGINPMNDNKFFYADATAHGHSLTIDAITLSGKKLHMWNTIELDGTILNGGFTPTNFTGGAAGTVYSVTVSNYKNYIFDHWDDGSSNNTRRITLQDDTIMTAYYKEMPLSNTGVYIPLYIYPSDSGWSDWAAVIDAKNKHSTVPIVAAVNPSNGVGAYKDQNFTNGITNLKAAGVIVLGYIATDFGTKDPAKVKFEISKYKDWYNVDGVMFDEMPSETGYENYYRELRDYARSLGMAFIKGNPGTNIPSTYVGAVDNLSIYEDEGYPSMSDLTIFHTKYDRSNFSFCSYRVPSLDQDFIINASNYVSLMCITNDKLPNPYDTVPPYFLSLVSMLDPLTQIGKNSE